MEVGSIVWARLASFPYWPAMVYPEITDAPYNGKGILVKFFADSERVAHISEDRLMPYEGLEKFQRYAQQWKNEKLSRVKNKKTAQITLTFNQMFVSKNKFWSIAVAEADAMNLLPIKKRRLFYDAILIDVLGEHEKTLVQNYNVAVGTSGGGSHVPHAPSPDAFIDLDLILIENDALTITSAEKMCIDIKNLAYDTFKMRLERMIDMDAFSAAISRLDTEYSRVIMKKTKPKTTAAPTASSRNQIAARQKRSQSLNIDVLLRSIGQRFSSITSTGHAEAELRPSSAPLTHSNSIDKKLEREALLESYIIRKYPSNQLFIGVKKKGPVCHQCHQRKDLRDGNARYCTECERENNNNPEYCVVCAESGDLVACKGKNCGKYYHQGDCLRYWPQHQINSRNSDFQCPSHVCHTCESYADCVNGHNIMPDSQLIKCLECPASFHRATACIPAGSEILSDMCMICPRHHGFKGKTVNTNWCFLCGLMGGELVFCDTCPASYHKQCLSKYEIKPGETYICEICESGKLPLYGEVVCAKLGSHKWWPAIIVPPWLVPDRINRLQKKNYFCVCFFDKTNSYAWLPKERVYQMEIGDGQIHGDEALKTAFEDSQLFLKKIKQTPYAYADPRKKPTKRKFVNIVGNLWIPPAKSQGGDHHSDVCRCQLDDEEPCGPWSGCINYLTKVECDARCPADKNCQNKNFQHRNYPKMEVIQTKGRGFGLFALENITINQFVIEYVGEVIVEREYQRRLEIMRRQKITAFYFLLMDTGLYIDATHKGNNARFANHSCDPNCELQKWTVNGVTRVGFFALKEIKRNAEITFNYGWLPEKDKTPCLCGSAKCAGFIGGRPLSNYQLTSLDGRPLARSGDQRRQRS